MTAISDDFNRADGALGTDWTVHQGAADINTNRFRVQTGGFTSVVATHNTSLSGVSQYIKVVFGTSNSLTFAELVFRFTDSSSPYYILQIDQDDGAADWYYYPSVGGTDALIQSTTFPGGGIASGDSVGVTIDGTGTSTVVRIWDGVTADAPSDASTWDGGAADMEFTNDPATAVNTGNIVGTGGTQSVADSLFFDSFFAGDIGGGGGPPTNQYPHATAQRNRRHSGRYL